MKQIYVHTQVTRINESVVGTAYVKGVRKFLLDKLMLSD